MAAINMASKARPTQAGLREIFPRVMKVSAPPKVSDVSAGRRLNTFRFGGYIIQIIFLKIHIIVFLHLIPDIQCICGKNTNLGHLKLQRHQQGLVKLSVCGA